MNYMIVPGLKQQQLNSYRRSTFIKNDNDMINFIVSIIERETGIALELLKSPTRTRDITEARHMAIFLIRKYTKAKAKAIGRYFGNRDHSTIIYATQIVEDLLVTDKLFRKRFNAIEEFIK